MAKDRSKKFPCLSPIKIKTKEWKCKYCEIDLKSIGISGAGTIYYCSE
jgi:hypothetical protein